MTCPKCKSEQPDTAKFCSQCAEPLPEHGGKTVVVQDVSKDPRYLAGSPLVKCEIVVPIFVKGQLVAEFDIESYFSNAFTPAEQEFVEGCASVVGMCLAKG